MSNKNKYIINEQFEHAMNEVNMNKDFFYNYHNGFINSFMLNF